MNSPREKEPKKKWRYLKIVLRADVGEEKGAIQAFMALADLVGVKGAALTVRLSLLTGLRLQSVAVMDTDGAKIDPEVTREASHDPKV